MVRNRMLFSVWAKPLDRVRCVDLHPTEPWVLTCLTNDHIDIWNYKTDELVCIVAREIPRQFSRKITRSVKFIARLHWIVAGVDESFIRVYNYNTMEKVKSFEAHTDTIRCVVVHPTRPYVLSSSDDMTIKLWDWEQGWACIRTFEGHTAYMGEIALNPKDTNTFASASQDKTVKIWNLRSLDAQFTLDHNEEVYCVDYSKGDKPYLATAGNKNVKIWDYQAKACVHTLTGLKDLTSGLKDFNSVCFHPDLPVIVTGSKDGTTHFWNATTYKVEKSLNIGYSHVWMIGYLKGLKKVAVACNSGVIVVKMGRKVPVVTMDNISGKIIWAKDYETQTVNLKSFPAHFEIVDGERLPLSGKELGRCDINPHMLKYSPNGRFVAACGRGEYIIYTSLSWRVKSYGSALDIVWSRESEVALIENTGYIKILNKSFQEKRSMYSPSRRIFGGVLLAVWENACLSFYDWEFRLIARLQYPLVRNIYWSDSGEYAAVACNTVFYTLRHSPAGIDEDLRSRDRVVNLFYNHCVKTGLWIGDCFVFTDSFSRLYYYAGKELTRICNLDRKMYLLGYLGSQDRLYLIDRQLDVVSFTLPLALIEFKTLVLRADRTRDRDDLERAIKVLPSVPRKELNKVAHFLESYGFLQDALGVATDLDYRFDLAIKLGNLDEAKAIAEQVGSESKWKQLGELEMSNGKFNVGEECLQNARDFSGLLLLYSCIGDVEGLERLSGLAKAAGKNNVAFVCFHLLGRLEDSIQLLIDCDRIPEAAFMARTYLPRKVPQVVELWRKDLKKVNPKAAESLANPQDFPGWEVALKAEDNLKAERAHFPQASEFLNYVGKMNIA